MSEVKNLKYTTTQVKKGVFTSIIDLLMKIVDCDDINKINYLSLEEIKKREVAFVTNTFVDLLKN